MFVPYLCTIMKRNLYYIAIIVSIGFACHLDRRNIKDYYYPVLDLQKGSVYVYELNVNGEKTTDYWYLMGFARDSGLYLASTNYDNQFQINQIAREKMTENGAVARSYYVYEQDSATQKAIQTEAVLKSPDIFPFSVKDSLGVFLFSLQYSPISEVQSKIYLIRNRRYLGDGPDFEFNGKKYATICMGIREAIGNEGEGSTEIEGVGEEWYAKGIGLVYFKKVYGDKGALRREYRLKEIISMDELIKRAGILWKG